jgi:RNA polymerase sigma-70 factor, ECF subfamily
MRELALPDAPVEDSAESDGILVRKAQRNPAPFAALYRRYVAPIHRYLYSRLGNTADAEDVTAEVFIEALRSLSRYRERGTFAAWLFTIARRKAVDHHRHSAPHVPFDDTPNASDPTGVDPISQSIRREALEELGLLVRRLTEDEQELLRLRFAAGLNYRQIGELVGRSEAAAKMAIHRLCKSLRTAWEAGNDARK